MTQINVGAIISFHEITAMTGFDDQARMFRVACSGEQARALADELEQLGWVVKQIVRTDAMDLASAGEYIRQGLGKVKTPGGEKAN